MTDAVLAALIGLAALLYSAVGHGGASGYLAVMALTGVAPEVMRPAALFLNVLVSSIAVWKFHRVGAFSWRVFWPLAIASIPCAWLGGWLELPVHWYKPVVGAVLLYAAWRSFASAGTVTLERVRPVSIPVLLLVGVALGFLSGLVGVGGGIFLSPLLLLLGWAVPRTVSGISATFILVNSLAGLAGVLMKHPVIPDALPLWGLAAVLGGWLGAEYGSRRLGSPAIRRVLAIVLVIAGAKMVLLP
ncbi:MAG: sulfite exporter TauE/SafE family protein [Gammaproteobacteria bacterium]|nr:MAG: sulfite exporter TauE/SafE family protein [Gammaproteobacteria bacterium]